MAIARPLKQTVIISVVCAIAVIATVAYVHGSIFSGRNASDSTVGIDASENQNQALSTSTDWQKSFIDASLATSSIKSLPASNEKKPTGPETMTSVLGKQAMIGYAALNQSGAIDDNDSLNAAAESMVTAAMRSQVPKTYTSANLKLTTATDLASMQRFSSEVSRALHLYTATRNEALIARDSMQNSNPNQMKQIQPIIANYSNIVSALLAIQTPQSMSENMVNLVNGFSTMKFVAESLSTISTDPVKGMLGISGYLNGTQSLMTSLKSIRDDLQAQGISFDYNQNMLLVMLNSN